VKRPSPAPRVSPSGNRFGTDFRGNKAASNSRERVPIPPARVPPRVNNFTRNPSNDSGANAVTNRLYGGKGTVSTGRGYAPRSNSGTKAQPNVVRRTNQPVGPKGDPVNLQIVNKENKASPVKASKPINEIIAET